MTKLKSAANHSGLDATVLAATVLAAAIEAEPAGVIAMEPVLAAIWELAAPFLTVRDNDAHTLYAFGLAQLQIDPPKEVGGRPVSRSAAGGPFDSPVIGLVSVHLDAGRLPDDRHPLPG
jgi:hypothetical protein